MIEEMWYVICSRPKNNSSKIAVQIHPKKGKFL